MKQYVIDELRIEDYYKIKFYLEENHIDNCMEGIYRVYIDQDILADEQAYHIECAPFYFAIELMEASISCELLVRAKNIIRCSCIRYANKKQRNWFIEYIDSLIERLNIIV